MVQITKFLILFLMLVMLVVPILSFAQPDTGIVQCGRTLYPANTLINGVDVSGTVIPCDFNDLLTLVNTVINFILVNLVVPIAAVMFAYAGFLLVTAGGEAAHARTKAKTIFTNAVWGLVIAVACWLIVKTILSILGYKFISDWF